VKGSVKFQKSRISGLIDALSLNVSSIPVLHKIADVHKISGQGKLASENGSPLSQRRIGKSQFIEHNLYVIKDKEYVSFTNGHDYSMSYQEMPLF
jgi:hypothetical protein